MSTYANKRIWRLERLKLSTNGNPRYRVYFEDDTTVGYRTSSDHGFCYALGNPDMREGCLVRVQFTRAGLISDMAPAAERVTTSDYDCADCGAVANGSPPYCGGCWRAMNGRKNRD